jgi:outer membrane immunogenic protein
MRDFSVRAAMAGAVVTMFAGAALADGGPRPAPGVTLAYDAPASWSGLYVGTQSGFTWSNSGWRFPFDEYYNTAAGQRFSLDPDGWLYGGHVGVNHQMGAWVVGAEVSYSGLAVSERRVGPIATFPQDQFQTKIEDLLLVTGRVGYAANNNLLVYGRAGYANAEVTIDAFSGPPGAGVLGHDSKRLDGWTLGVGAEWRFHPNMSFGLEYNYIDLNGSRYSSTTTGTSVGLPFNVDLDDTQIHTVMARFNILFGRDRGTPAPLK